MTGVYLAADDSPTQMDLYEDFVWADPAWISKKMDSYHFLVSSISCRISHGVVIGAPTGKSLSEPP